MEWLGDKIGKVSHKLKKKQNKRQKQDRKIKSFYTAIIKIIGAPKEITEKIRLSEE